VRVKICGITREEDALLAVSAGAWAVGAVVCSQSRRSIPLRKAARIFSAVEGTAITVAVSHSKLYEDLEQILAIGPDAIQISHPHHFDDRDVLLFRVVQRGDPIPSDCDAVILDESHGMGIPLDTGFARELVQRSQVPVILAGGLNPENLGVAIRGLNPYAVDVASGVESAPGVKDPEKVKAFMEACRRLYA
jgi:phosphoribosylanthranilate isomerase